jgi:HEAT repeat protein
MKPRRLAIVAAVLLVPGLALATMLAVSRRTEVEQALAAVERLPAPARLDELSENLSVPYLAAIIEDKSAPAKARLSALTALAGYPGKASEELLRRFMVDFGASPTGVSTLYTRAAMRSLAVLAGPRAADDLVPALLHPAPDVRAEAAHSLVVANARQAVPQLRVALAGETSRLVRQAFDEAILTLTVPVRD